MNFRIAVLQMRSKAGELETNTLTVINKMKQAAAEGANLLLLPESFISGYDFPIQKNSVIGDDSTYIEDIRTAAKKYNISVIATAFTRGEKKPYNTAYVIDNTGKILMKYNKVHTCDFAAERELQSGDEFKVCECNGVKLGVMICYDREYPESARILMLKGAEIILNPNDCGSMRPRVQALSTRAYENMTGVVMANPNGENAGCSCAFSPICWDKDGICVENTIFMADEMTEGLFYADYNMDELRQYREKEMLGNTYRKVKAYRELLNDNIEYPFNREPEVNNNENFTLADKHGRIEFRKISEFPRGILHDLLVKGYSFDERFNKRFGDDWIDFDNFFFDNPEIADKYGFITTLDEEPIGLVSWDPRNRPEYVEVGHNCIVPEYKGHGYGRIELAEAVKRIKSYEGLKRITVFTNEVLLPARHNYEGVGFKEIRRRDNTDSVFAGKYIDYEIIL